MIHRFRKKCGPILLFLLLTACSGLSAQQLVDERFQATPLSEVFSLFSDKYGLLLSYDPTILSGQTIDLQIREENTLRAFYQVLHAADLDYLTLDQQRILIRPSATPPPAPPSYWRLSGLVRDEDTGEGLPYATVHCAQYGWGTSANEAGYFELRIPDTIQHRLIWEGRYLGYEATSLRLIPGSDQALNFDLQANSQEIGMVIITEEVAKIGIANSEQALVVRPDDDLPALGGTADVMRNLQLLPGITAANDQSAALQIRGGQATDNLILWDGMLLYNVDHLFGAFSAVNPQLVESVRLYKNSFPIEYAGRSASVLTIQSHPPATSSITNLNLGNLLVEGASRIKLHPNWQLQIGGRSSLNRLVNTDLFNQLNQQVDADGANLGQFLEESQQVEIRPAFTFYDLNGKLAWQASSNTYFDLNFYRSADQYDYDYALLFRTRLPNRIGENSLRFAETSNWLNSSFSSRWLQQWNDNWRSELSIGFSRYEVEETSTTTLSRERPDGDFSVVTRKNDRDNQVEGYHLNWRHSYQHSAHGQLTFGLRLMDERVGLRLSNDTLRLLSNEAQASQLGLYAAHNWQWKNWDLQFGLHGTHYSGTRNMYASPRLLFGYQANEHWYLKGSLNLYHQYLRRYYSENRFGRSFQIWTLANENFWPVAQTQQAMLGFTYRNRGFSLDLEGYYKYTDGVLEYTTLINDFEETETGGVAGGQNTFRISQGTGQVVGLDLLLRQDWDHFQTYLSYTLSRSTRQFTDLFQGLSFASQDDRPHQVQWVNKLHKGHWSFSGVYILASGRPFLDLSANNLAADRRNRLPGDLRRIPTYHRVDLSARYEIDIKQTRLHASLAVLNLFDRDNTLYEQHVYAIPSSNNRTLLLGNDLQLLERTISFSVGVDF